MKRSTNKLASLAVRSIDELPILAILAARATLRTSPTHIAVIESSTL